MCMSDVCIQFNSYPIDVIFSFNHVLCLLYSNNIFAEYVNVLVNQCVKQKDPRPGLAYLDKVFTELKGDKK